MSRADTCCGDPDLETVHLYALTNFRKQYPVVYKLPNKCLIILRLKAPVSGQHPCSQWKDFAESIYCHMPLTHAVYVADASPLPELKKADENLSLMCPQLGAQSRAVYKCLSRLMPVQSILVAAGPTTASALKLLLLQNQRYVKASVDHGNQDEDEEVVSTEDCDDLESQMFGGIALFSPPIPEVCLYPLVEGILGIRYLPDVKPRPVQRYEQIASAFDRTHTPAAAMLIKILVAKSSFSLTVLVMSAQEQSVWQGDPLVKAIFGDTVCVRCIAALGVNSAPLVYFAEAVAHNLNVEFSEEMQHQAAFDRSDPGTPLNMHRIRFIRNKWTKQVEQQVELVSNDGGCECDEFEESEENDDDSEAEEGTEEVWEDVAEEEEPKKLTCIKNNAKKKNRR